jgi:subtilase family serine protease
MESDIPGNRKSHYCVTVSRDWKKKKLLRMNVKMIKTFLFASLLGAQSSLLFGASQAPKRLRSNISDSETFVLKGNTRPVVTSGLAQDQGPVSDSKVMPRMSVHFTLTAAQQADLTQLLAAQQNRRSPQFHKGLTPEQYADRFGLNSADIAKISTWLENNGFSNLQVARSRTWVAFNGTAAQAEAAFHTSIHNYSLNGEAHFANASDPQLPKALEGIAESVRGLHNFLMKPHIRLPKPHFTSSISGDTYLVPDDWTTIYDVKPLYNAGYDGSPISGETYSIAVVGQSDVVASDLANFRAAAGLSAKTVTVIIPTGDKDPGLQLKSGDEGESDLDLEWSNAIAKNGNIAFVTADSDPDNGVQDAITYVIDNNLAPILSTSYGLCEPQVYESPADFNTEESLFMQANAQMMTIVAASGDDGAADCDSATTETVATMGLAVDYPASSEFVTGIGGTTLQAEGVGTYFSSTNNSPGQGSAQSYIPETTWNDGFQNATGGGVSILVLKPSWQTGTGVPNDGHRDVPDLAFASSPNTDGLLFCTPPPANATYTTCVNGTFRNSDTSLNVTGGTSTGPPTLAGILAMLVQQTGARLGNINPNLYSLASVSHTAFHDITTGNNDVTCEGGSPNCPSLTATVNGTFGYSAGVGYDQVTGWGSLDAYNFVEQWSSDIELSPTPSTLTVNAGSSGTVTVNLAAYKNFPGTSAAVTCSVGSGLVNVTCSVGNSGNAAIPGSATVTITAASNAAAPPRLRLIRNIPPPRPQWLLFALLLGLTMSLFRNRRLLPLRAMYACAVPALALLSFGVVSCGGGSSSGSGSGGVTALAISCTLPATAQVGASYSGSCSASGGIAPYAYSITSGSLPAGLTLNASTGAITGTPTLQGTGSFTVTATDSESPAMTASQAVSNFTVAAPAVETGNITITATSGTIVNTTTVAVTVPSS